MYKSIVIHPKAYTLASLNPIDSNLENFELFFFDSSKFLILYIAINTTFYLATENYKNQLSMRTLKRLND